MHRSAIVEMVRSIPRSIGRVQETVVTSLVLAVRNSNELRLSCIYGAATPPFSECHLSTEHSTIRIDVESYNTQHRPLHTTRHPLDHLLAVLPSEGLSHSPNFCRPFRSLCNNSSCVSEHSAQEPSMRRIFRVRILMKGQQCG